VDFLRPYDVFVGDNAKIQANGECKVLAEALWNSLRILWLPLPPYAPEINPTEKNFQTMVQRGNKIGPRYILEQDAQISDIAAFVLDGFTREEVVQFYRDSGVPA